MTKKEYILDSLIDDDEAISQIIEYFKFIELEISIDELKLLLDEMLKEELIVINRQWKNEKNEYPFSLTIKGRKMWKNKN